MKEKLCEPVYSPSAHHPLDCCVASKSTEPGTLRRPSLPVLRLSNTFPGLWLSIYDFSPETGRHSPAALDFITKLSVPFSCHLKCTFSQNLTFQFFRDLSLMQDAPI